MSRKNWRICKYLPVSSYLFNRTSYKFNHREVAFKMFVVKLCILAIFSANLAFGETIIAPISNLTESINSIEDYNSNDSELLPSEKFTPDLMGAFLMGLLSGMTRRTCRHCRKFITSMFILK